MGVPTLGCHCAVCDSTDSNDKRTRPSLMLTYNDRNVVIDTTPDFRQQALREHIDRLDAVIYTHSHADHILGLDDIRPYNLKQKALVPIYATERTQETLRRQFAYIFDEGPTESSLPGVELRTIDGPFDLFGLTDNAGARQPRVVASAGIPIRERGVPDRFQHCAGIIEAVAVRAGRFHSGRAALPAASDTLERGAVRCFGERSKTKASMVYAYLPRSGSRRNQCKIARERTPGARWAEN